MEDTCSRFCQDAANLSLSAGDSVEDSDIVSVQDGMSRPLGRSEETIEDVPDLEDSYMKSLPTTYFPKIRKRPRPVDEVSRLEES
jgi:hypothetical protein